MSTRRLENVRTANRKLRPESKWIRNPAWPALTDPLETDQKLVGLFAVFEGVGDVDVAALGFGAATYSVDWGDGTSDNAVTGFTSHSYSFSSSGLYDATVTLTDATDTVTRNDHGYSNSDEIRFYRIQNTTGLTEGGLYYVINATQNTFQVAMSVGGAAVSLTTDGSASLLPYKIATVTAEADAGSTITQIELNRVSGTYNYSSISNWLEISVAAPNCTNFNQTVNANKLANLLERLKIVSIGQLTSAISGICGDLYRMQEYDLPIGFKTTSTNATYGMRGNHSVRVAPLIGTSNVTNFQNYFQNCNSLEYIPKYDTSSCANVSNMFTGCKSLRSIPLLDFQSATNMSATFQNCYRLERIPKLNTSNVTNANNCFANCANLRDMPQLDWSSLQNAQSMFSECNSLSYIPFLTFTNVTTLQSAFQNCSSLQTVTLQTSANLLSCQNTFYGCSCIDAIPVFDTSAVTDIRSMFRDVKALTEIPEFDFSSVTLVDSNSFANNRCIKRMRFTGLGVSFTVANCSLSSDALDEIYTNLPTVTGKTITVSGNPGVSGDNPSIATAKGWTVSG